MASTRSPRASSASIRKRGSSATPGPTWPPARPARTDPPACRSRPGPARPWRGTSFPGIGPAFQVQQRRLQQVRRRLEIELPAQLPAACRHHLLAHQEIQLGPGHTGRPIAASTGSVAKSNCPGRGQVGVAGIGRHGRAGCSRCSSGAQRPPAPGNRTARAAPAACRHHLLAHQEIQLGPGHTGRPVDRRVHRLGGEIELLRARGQVDGDAGLAAMNAGSLGASHACRRWAGSRCSACRPADWRESPAWQPTRLSASRISRA